MSASSNSRTADVYIHMTSELVIASSAQGYTSANQRCRQGDIWCRCAWRFVCLAHCGSIQTIVHLIQLADWSTKDEQGVVLAAHALSLRMHRCFPFGFK